MKAPGFAALERRFVHLERIPVRWGDMDAMGHVNNTVYFRYMEQARIAWFASLGCAADPDGFGPVIVNASCTFRREIVYPGTVEVSLYTGVPGGSSMPTYYEMRMQGDAQTLHADGAATVVWVDFPRGRPVRLPEEIRAHAPTDKDA